MKGSRSRAPRGQAVVELALGTLVLVVILIVGIHFAEYGFMWVKLTETANFALFDETNRKMHDTGADTWNNYFGGAVGSNIGNLNSPVQARYKDFNGLSSVTAASTLTQVFTRGSGLTVSCKRYGGNGGGLGSGGPNLDMAAAGKVAQAAFGKAATENAGLSCQVDAKLSRFHMPNRFEFHLGYDPKVIAGTTTSPMACAAGRPSGGSCAGHGFRMLLDDWGFQGASEAGQCPLSSSGCGPNPGYYRMAQATYTAAGGSDGTAGTKFAEGVIGFSPADEQPFWMSFRGEEGFDGNPAHAFQEQHASSGDTIWPTTPYNDPNSAGIYAPAYSKNDKCFLGWKC